MSQKWFFRSLYPVALGLFVAACGGGGDIATEGVDQVSSTSQQIVVTEAPTTTADLRQAAADRYVEIVTPSNCALALYDLSASEAEERFRASSFASDQEAFEYWRVNVLSNADSLADAYLKMVSELGIYEWPEEVQESVDELITQMLSEAAVYSSYANLGTWQALIDWEWPPAPTTNPAGVIRAKLGLPSNVNNDEAFCDGLLG